MFCVKNGAGKMSRIVCSHALIVAIWILCGGFVAGSDNILLIVADDVGVDNIGCYAEGADPPRTPDFRSFNGGV